MAVTIYDQRAVWNPCESLTDWGSNTGTASDLYAGTPAPREGTNCIGITVSTATEDYYYEPAAGGPFDFRHTVWYMWILPQGEIGNFATGGLSMYFGDGTNSIAYHIGGSDFENFKRFSWQCAFLDQDNLPAFHVIAGSEAALNWSAITQMGIEATTLSKALGGGQNIFIDVIRYGYKRRNGLIITGGEAGDPGTFEQIVAEDNSVATGKAYGVIRELTSGIYGLQGSLIFGNGRTGLESVYFKDTDAVVSFENKLIERDKFTVQILGNPTGNTYVEFGNKIGAGDTAVGSSGVFFQSAGPAWSWIVSGAGDTDVDDFLMFGSQIKGANMLPEFSIPGVPAVYAGVSGGPPIQFEADAGHEFIGGTVTQSYKVSAGSGIFRGDTFSASTTAASGALLWNPNIDVAYCDFTDNSHLGISNRDDGAWYRGGAAVRLPSGFGIHHPVSGAFLYDHMNFSGNDADIYFSGRGTLTIQTDESNPVTYVVDRDDADVDIQISATLTLNGIVSGSEVNIMVAGQTTVINELFHLENTTEDDGLGNSPFTTKAEYTYNYSGDFNIDISILHIDYGFYRINNLLVGDTSTSIPISQQNDPWYNNPT